MAPFVLGGSILRKILLAAACVLAYSLVQTPCAYAQRSVPHPSSGGRVVAPHVVVPPTSRPVISPASHPMISRPRVFTGPRPMGAGMRIFPFRPRSINVFPRGVFAGAPFLRIELGLGVDYFWWETWDPLCVWGLNCSVSPYGYGLENYVAPQPYENPSYFYGEERPLVWLYLKDGTVFGVPDYWFVNGQIHFITLEEGGAKSAERAIAFDELDVQKTVDVNTQRGFRVVMRDEPLEQYLRDHRDLTPPLLQVPPKN